MKKSGSKGKSRPYSKKEEKDSVVKGKSETYKNKSEDNTYIPYKSKPNDWRWYAANEQILRDVASYPYQWPLGNTINYGPMGYDANKWSLPGICAIEVNLIPGHANDPNDPVNIAARNAYSYIRHANSGSSNYDSPDLMIYFLAMDQAYAMLEFMKRVYGVTLTTSQTNKYYPKAMVEAMRVDYDDIRRNLADFRALINTYAVKLGSLCVPATMSFMAKHEWLFKGLYLDKPVDKSQTYMFIPHGYFTYQLDSDGAGMLKFNQMFHGQKKTMADLQTIMDSILDPILYGVGVQDFNIMSGDILKAYGPGNVIKVDMIPENYTVLPSYDETVLDQIQNLTLMGWLTNTGSTRLRATDNNDIYQDSTKSYLIYDPTFINVVPYLGWTPRPSAVTAVAGDNCFQTNRIITFEHGDVEPKDTMEATRMTNIANVVDYIPGIYGQYIKCDTMGSEVACRATMYRYEIDANGLLVLAEKHGFNQSWTFLNIISDMTSTTVDTVASDIRDMYDYMHQLMTCLTYFNRHMPVAITAGLVDEATGTWYFDSFNGYFGDVNYYTIIGRDDLKMMSEAALLSEFAVTQFGRAATK